MWRNCWHGTELLAFDVESRKPVDIAGMNALLGAAIRSDFRLPNAIEDPVKWATETGEAGAWFQARSRN
jgi:hypothetical protein